MNRTVKGYSRDSFERALDNAIALIPPSKAALRTMDNQTVYNIIKTGKIVGGIDGKDDYFVEVEIPD